MRWETLSCDCRFAAIESFLVTTQRIVHITTPLSRLRPVKRDCVGTSPLIKGRKNMFCSFPLLQKEGCPDTVFRCRDGVVVLYFHPVR